jgi:hypothetical protein
MGKTTAPYALNRLAAAVAALAPRLGAEQAAAACRLTLDAMGKNTNPYVVGRLARAVAALAPRLGAEQAAAAYRLALDAMGKNTAPDAPVGLAEAAAALAPWLGAEQAAAACRLALDAMGKKSTNPLALGPLARAVAALAPRLGAEQAAAAYRLALDAMGKNTYLEALGQMAVAALLIKQGPEGTSRRTRFLTAAIGNAGALPNLLAGLAPLPEAARPLPGRFTEQQLVDFLKMPTSARPAREVILRQLGWQCGRTFAHKWEFVDWARQHRPDLDLASPPARIPEP